MATYIISDTSSTTSLIARPYKHTQTGISGTPNYRKTPAFLTKSCIPRNASLPTTGVYLTGIGGIGNCHSFEDRPVITKQEDLARQRARRQSAAMSWHHGIGGAGNRKYSDKLSSRSSSISSADGSGAVTRSGADRMKERVVAYLGRK
jgi:hypothetical protein